jgi:hypothetical protein
VTAGDFPGGSLLMAYEYPLALMFRRDNGEQQLIVFHRVQRVKVHFQHCLSPSILAYTASSYFFDR